MFFTALFTALVLGTSAQVTFPLNDWINTVGKRNILLDPSIVSFLPKPDWYNTPIGKRNSILDSLTTPAIPNLNWLQLLGKRLLVENDLVFFRDDLNHTWVAEVLKNQNVSHWTVPLNQNLILSDKRRQSIIDPQLIGLWSNNGLHFPLIDRNANRRNLESIITPVDLGIIPFNPNLILSKKRRQSILGPTINPGLPTGHNPLIDYILSKKRRQSILGPTINPGLPTGHNPLIDYILSKKRRQSIISPINILGLPTGHNPLIDILSKRNIVSITGPTGTVFNGILPFNSNLILSKKRDILQGSSTTFNPLILSKRVLDLASFWSPGVDGSNFNSQQQLLQALGGKRDSQALISLTGDGLVPFLPYLINSKKRDILQGSSTTFNPLILSKRVLDLASFWSPGVDGSNFNSQQQLLQALGGKRDSQALISLTGDGLVPFLPYLINSKKRDILQGSSTTFNPLILSRRASNLASILSQRIAGGLTLQQLLDQIVSKRNLQSILTPPDLGIIPFNPNLILSKKRDILFDPLHPDVISKKSIWNPLIDILLPPIKDLK